MARALSKRAAAEAYRGERLRVDEAAAADIYKQVGVAEKVCAEERALDLSDDEIPDVGILAEGEGEAPLAESLDGRLIGGRELDGMPCLSCGEAGMTLTCAPVSMRNRRFEELSSM